MAETNAITCSEPECNRLVSVRIKGLCSMHYQRLRKHGSTDKPKREFRLIEKPCAFCGTRMMILPSVARNQNCCSIACGQRFRSGRPLSAYLCAHCHKEIPGRVEHRGENSYCNRKCYGASLSHLSEEKAALRRIEQRIKMPIIMRAAILKKEVNSLFKVFDRDGWKCHICGTKTPKKNRGTYKDDAPELEHIISLADGGSHTWGNVACACRKCNISKGARSYGQLGFNISV